MSEKIKTAVMEVIKAHMEGEDKNTKAVLSDVMESVNELETLEQEPCDNAISRSDMLDAIGHGTTYTSEELQRIIQNLPPVTHKSGKWLKHSYARKCSECGSATCWTDDEGTPIPDKYCPNCGAKMESEDKE